MKKDFTGRMAAGLNVPPETLCHMPMGILRGKGEFSLENHCGILIYETDHIRIAVKRGAVVLRGRDLTISNMSRNTLCIKGNISVIELE